MVAALSFFGVLSCISGVIAGLVMARFVGWWAVFYSLGGFGAGIQFFALAAILGRVTEVLDVVDPPEETPPDRLQLPPELGG